jgi:putative membrane protein
MMEKSTDKSRFNRRSLLQWGLLALGIAMLVAVFWSYDSKKVLATFAQAGWGLLGAAVFHFIPLISETLGWRALFADQKAVPYRKLYVYRWIGESINNLLPVGHVGGDAERARLAAKAGAGGVQAGAAGAADFTVGLVVELLVAVIAVVLLAMRTSLDGSLRWILWGSAAFAVLVAILLIVQLRGGVAHSGRWLSGLLSRLTNRSAEKLNDDVNRLNEAVKNVYRHRSALLICGFWRLWSWLIGAGEILIALYLFGHPVGIGAAIALQGLTVTIRSAAFFIPAGLGVQEQGFILVGEALGLSPPIALSVGLVRRIRELLLGVPGLAIWWYVATRKRHRSATA